MEAILLVLLIVHGIIHIYGFINEYYFKDVKIFSWKRVLRLSNKTAKVVHFLWLLVSALLFYSAFALLLGLDWRISSLLAVILSQVLIILYIKHAWVGTILNILIATAVFYL